MFVSFFSFVLIFFSDWRPSSVWCRRMEMELFQPLRKQPERVGTKTWAVYYTFSLQITIRIFCDIFLPNSRTSFFSLLFLFFSHFLKSFVRSRGRGGGAGVTLQCLYISYQRYYHLECDQQHRERERAKEKWKSFQKVPFVVFHSSLLRRVLVGSDHSIPK